MPTAHFLYTCGPMQQKNKELPGCPHTVCHVLVVTCSKHKRKAWMPATRFVGAQHHMQQIGPHCHMQHTARVARIATAHFVRARGHMQRTKAKVPGCIHPFLICLQPHAASKKQMPCNYIASRCNMSNHITCFLDTLRTQYEKRAFS